MKICIACNAKSEQVESPLEGDALDMFNFVCCLSAEVSFTEITKDKKISQLFSIFT